MLHVRDGGGSPSPQMHGEVGDMPQELLSLLFISQAGELRVSRLVCTQCRFGFIFYVVALLCSALSIPNICGVQGDILGAEEICAGMRSCTDAATAQACCRQAVHGDPTAA